MQEGTRSTGPFLTWEQLCSAVSADNAAAILMDGMKSLSSGSMCQLQFSIHIADGIDTGKVGLKMFICQDTATFHGRSKTVSK